MELSKITRNNFAQGCDHVLIALGEDADLSVMDLRRLLAEACFAYKREVFRTSQAAAILKGDSGALINLGGTGAVVATVQGDRLAELREQARKREAEKKAQSTAPDGSLAGPKGKLP